MGCQAVRIDNENQSMISEEKDNQKFMIEAILLNTNYDMVSLATILQISPILVSRVISGKAFLSSETEQRLLAWFQMVSDGMMKK